MEKRFKLEKKVRKGNQITISLSILKAIARGVECIDLHGVIV